MRISIKYALWITMLNLCLIGLAFILSERFLWENTARLATATALHSNTITEAKKHQDNEIIRVAVYLSKRLFDPLYALKIGQLERIINDELNVWLPIKYVHIADSNGLILTDGTAENKDFMQSLSIATTTLDIEKVILEHRDNNHIIAFKVAYEGVNAGYVEIALEDGQYQGIISEQSSEISEAMQALTNTIYQLGLIVFITIIILTAVFSWLISRYLSSPLKQLRDAAINVANGNFTVTLDKQNKDELGELATAFTKMTQDLEISTSQLKEAKEKAEVANQAKSIFLANMSHELRTPLNAILGHAQLLERNKNLEGNLQKSIAIVRRSGEHLLNLINDILDLSRVESGRIELYFVEFNLNDFINDIVDMFNIRAQQKSLGFYYCPCSNLPSYVIGDDKRLRQVLINLLGNALKFTEQGEINLRLKYNTEQSSLYIAVEDTGIGIKDTDKEIIFAPFRQTGDRYYQLQGSGLGLSISQRLIKLMGGEIKVSSELGKGTCFYFEIPLKAISNKKQNYVGITPLVEKKQVISGYQLLPNSPIVAQQRQSYRLLAVDDKEENLNVLKQFLEPLGFEIIFAHNGKEAIESVIQFQPDLIFMDLIMPILSGIEAVRNLRIVHHSTIPIIAVSASAFGIHEKESIQAGCNAYFSKPYKFETILKCLETWLPLTWTYSESPKTESLANEMPETPQTEKISFDTKSYEHILTKEQAKFFYDNAMIGNVIAITKQADFLKQNYPELTALMEKIIELAEKFDDELIADLMKPYL